MIKDFKDKGSEDLFKGRSSKAARKACPISLWQTVFRKLDLLDSAVSLNEEHKMIRVPTNSRNAR